MVATEIILARHAAHGDLGTRLTGRAPGPGLSRTGEGQAAALGRWLRARNVSALECSPRERARATATIVGRHLGLTATVEAALDEIDFGEWNGAAFAALDGDPLWRWWNEARDMAAPPGGETMAAAGERLVAHIADAAGRTDGGTVAMISHCDMIRGAVALYLGLPMQAVFRFEVAPASVTVLRMEAGHVTLVSLNERVCPEAALPEQGEFPEKEICLEKGSLQ